VIGKYYDSLDSSPKWVNFVLVNGPVIGVLSSWLIMARNWDFALLAASIASSASLCSVTSAYIHKRPWAAWPVTGYDRTWSTRLGMINSQSSSISTSSSVATIFIQLQAQIPVKVSIDNFRKKV
jgi:hypothetical protein